MDIERNLLFFVGLTNVQTIYMKWKRLRYKTEFAGKIPVTVYKY